MIKYLMKEFWNDEDGIGIVEIILILVILIGLVVIFKSEISTIVSDAFTAITGGSDTIIN